MKSYLVLFAALALLAGARPRLLRESAGLRLRALMGGLRPQLRPAAATTYQWEWPLYKTARSL
jgi:hypothetical protein